MWRSLPAPVCSGPVSRFVPALTVLFVIIPLVEIALFVAVGQQIGFWPMVLIVIVTAVAGSLLVSRQGRNAYAQLRLEFMEGRFPGKSLAHGAMILVAGALLITPGFLTDVIGFLLLVPAVRERLRLWAVRRYTPGRTITL
jgi:UPF0716 protein FxsA